MVLPAVSAAIDYTPSTRTACNEGTCTQTIFSGTEYVEEKGEWKHYTEAKSLKDVEGFEIKVLEDDKDYNLEVVDFNATSITVDLNPDGLSIFTKDVPVRIWNEKSEGSIKSDFKNTYEKSKEEQLSFHLLNQEETKTYTFGLGDILEFGPNSTTIILQTADTENLDDTYIRESDPSDTSGSDISMSLKEGFTDNNNDGLIKFSLSSIPTGSLVESATLSLNLYDEDLESGDEVLVESHHIFDAFSWNEATMDWDAKPDSGVDYNATVEDSVNFDSSSTTGIFYNWTAGSSVATSVNAASSSVSFYLDSTGTNLDDQNDRIELYTKEGAVSANRPKLYITYDPPAALPYITFPLNQTYKSVLFFNWTITNFTALDTCLYSLNDAANVSVNCGVNGTYITSVDDSSNNILFWVNTTDGKNNFTSRTYTIDTIDPSVVIDTPGALIDFGKPGGNFQLNWTISDTNLANCSYFYNNTNTTTTCSNNGASIPLVETWKNITVYANDSAGNLGTDTQLFDYKVFQNSITSDAITYETATDNYILNISSDGSETITAVLYYNGTSYSPTKVGNNEEMTFTSTITHPVNDVGNKSFYWNVTHGASEIKTDTTWQDVQNFTLNLCNGTNGETYVNFTFKDEEADTFMNSTFEIDDEWQYYLGTDNTIYKTLTFNNQSTNPNYAFCLWNSNETMNFNSVTFRYDNTGYPERLHTRTGSLTNDTTNQLLYLLATADGQETSFQVQNTAGGAIVGASVQAERKFGGAWTVIGIDETDSSGTVTFFVNPSREHRFTFTKSGFTTQVLTIRPTQSIYTVVMPGGVVAPIYYPELEGITWEIFPAQSTVLNTGTEYIFTYNITSNKSNLDSYKIELYDKDLNLLDSLSGATAAGSDLSITLNTTTNKQIIGKYYYNIGNGTFQNDLRTWTVLTVDQGGYSLESFFDGIDMSEMEVEGKFTAFFIFFLVLFGGISLITRATGMEIVMRGIALPIVLALVWIVSFGGFFTINFTGTAFINQYYAALAMTAIVGGFSLGQMRRI